MRERFSLNLMPALTAYAQLLSYIDKRPRRVSPGPESSIEDVLILRCEGREDFSKATPPSALVEGLRELVVLHSFEHWDLSIAIEAGQVGNRVEVVLE